MRSVIIPQFFYQRPFAVVAIASAVLCLAVAGCWVYSLFASFGQAWANAGGALGDGHQTWVWVVEGGSLHVLRHDRQVTPAIPSVSDHIYHAGYDPVGRMALRLEPTRLGFAFRNEVHGWVDPFRRTRKSIKDIDSQWSIPLWLPAVLLALPAAVWLAGRRRQLGQQLRDVCVGCGYDLRATPHRCPECGLEVHAPARGLAAARRTSASPSNPPR